MHIDFDRFDKLVIETGKTKSYLCRAIEKSRYYLRDAKKTDADIPEETVKRLADELNTTVDYLQGYTDVKEKPTAGAVSFEDVVKAVKSMDREQLVKLAIIIAQEQGER